MEIHHMGQRLFVYGTLKRGHCREAFLQEQQFLGPAQTLPLYRMYDCGSYPGLVDRPTDGVSLQGELWEVTSECLAILDRVEELDSGLYDRHAIQLTGPVDIPVQAYFYQGVVTGLSDCGPCWVGC
ncbi:MAG: gamma-glutamylcyclotransferase [Planctomycetota bacterium]|nr:MAG: gamma-glutamylcyclotransferase [Planctomycetota bacterium]